MDHHLHRNGNYRPMNRRLFLGVPTLLSAAARPMRPAPQRSTAVSQHERGVQEFLTALTYTRKEVDTFLDSSQPNFARFDEELGYLLRDHVMKNGVDGSRSIVTFAKTGERTMINYAHLACRINAYGDSFTQGFQVSDGETWPEYLAAHLGEPIRNFGIGGYGVYQAYRRMLREEVTSARANCILLNIYGMDDHLRSIDAWRWLRFGERWRGVPGALHLFHGNPWVHARLNFVTDELEEKPNLFPSPGSLYDLTNPDRVIESFRNDLIVKLLASERLGVPFDTKELVPIAEKLGVLLDFSSPQATAQTARELLIQYGLRVSMKIVEKARTFAEQQGSKLMVLLSYDTGSVRLACEGSPREDRVFVDFLKDHDIPLVDSLAKHVEDFRAFNLSAQEYVNRYYIGHYKPQGNHFFAFAIKDAVVDWLDPKPLSYRRGAETIR